jgi:predicted RNA-binding protein with EMAP domain
MNSSVQNKLLTSLDALKLRVQALESVEDTATGLTLAEIDNEIQRMKDATTTSGGVIEKLGKDLEFVTRLVTEAKEVAQLAMQIAQETSGKLSVVEASLASAGSVSPAPRVPTESGEAMHQNNINSIL